MALMQVNIFPLGTGSASVGEFVVAMQELLARQDLPYLLNDMGTQVQGEPGELLALAARLAELPFASGVDRVVTQITIDDRRDKEVGLGDKTASVLNRLKKTPEPADR